MRVVWLAACVCLLWFVPAAAQVYKWVDGNGVTHYGEKPPAASKSREVKLHDAKAPAAAPAPAGTPAYKDREIEFRKRQAERERDETKASADRASKQRECQVARNELSNLRASGRVYELSERGERVWMSDARRESEVGRLEAEYNRHCG